MSAPEKDAHWRDPHYLRETQYPDSGNLAARANIHAKYGRGDWMSWLAERVDWPQAGAVLEVGCGPGWFWAEAAERIPVELALTLTDLSPGMVAEAEARVRGLGRWPVSVQVADAAVLPFADASFDVVLACHMLYHLADPAAGLAEIARVLRPGGQAVIATNGEGHLREFAQLALAATGSEMSDASSAFTLEIAEPLLREKFSEVRLHRYPDRLLCTDADDVMAYLMSSPPCQGASAPVLQRLRRLVIEAFRAEGALEVAKSTGVFICRR